MWQQRMSCEQSNVVDVTIQCQFNLASKNLTEVSTMFGTPEQPQRQSTIQPDSQSYYNSQLHTPSKYRPTCEFESQQHTYNRFHNQYYFPSNIQAGTPYGYQHVLRPNPSLVTQLNDSGYSSPSSQYPHQIPPNHTRTTPSPTNHSPTNGFHYPTFSQNAWANNHCNFGNVHNQARPETTTPDTDDHCEEMKIAMRERDVTQRLFALKDANKDVADEIEQYYQAQTSMIDVERHNILYQMAFDKNSTNSINQYYNRKLLSLLESVEQKLSASESDKKVKSVKTSSGVPSKKSRLLPTHAVKILESWYHQNLENPYPSRDVTLSMASEGGITVEQIRKWFANKRNRSRNSKLKKSLLDE